jgi:hypothetical protein
METTTEKPYLVLIPGGLRDGEVAEGPITRMGLWHRFPQPSKAQLALILVGKLLLLSVAALYFFH